MTKTIIREQVRNLRRKGSTYSEICVALGKNISKSTLSCWCRGVMLSPSQVARISKINSENLARGRKIRILERIKNREKNFSTLQEKFQPIITQLSAYQKKLLLAVLYLGEGGKMIRRSAVMLGNSDPKIIELFLKLMRSVYDIDESKFRCTVQCRADQDIKWLEKYWSNITNVPLNKFYKAQIDKRSIGKKTEKKDYRGVLRIDYFSSEIFNEIINLSKIVCEGL